MSASVISLTPRSICQCVCPLSFFFEMAQRIPENMVSGTEIVGHRASLGLSIKIMILISLDDSYLILFYLEWSGCDLNGTCVFFRLVASQILSNRLKNGSLDVVRIMNLVRVSKRARI